MTALQSSQDPTGYGARDGAVATPPMEYGIMPLTVRNLPLLLLGVFMTAFDLLLRGSFPLLGLVIIGYVVYQFLKPNNPNQGTHQNVPASTGYNASSYRSTVASTANKISELGKISPSRHRGYNRLMEIFNAHQIVGLPVDQAHARLKPFFGDDDFVRHLLNHPNVMTLLGLNTASTANAATRTFESKSQASEPSTNWWQSEERCGEGGCNQTVTDFDYRCFTCRKHFCSAHRGPGVDCHTCSST